MLGAAMFSLAAAIVPSAALADISDYQFQPTQTEIKKSEAAEIAVRLVNTKTGAVVPGAIIIAKRVDMAPDGMADMATSVEALPSSEAGIYRFKTDVRMAGGWRLSLGAKIQGEKGTLENKLVFKVIP